MTSVEATISSELAAKLEILSFTLSIIAIKLSASLLMSFNALLTSFLLALLSMAASLLESDKLLICSATTAKPFPASPALAASIEAFKESRLVWLAISVILLFFPLAY